MSNPPNIEDVWQEYLDEIRMNCVFVDRKNTEYPVTLGQEGEDALLVLFNRSIKILIEVHDVPWVDDPGQPGIARRFILAMAAAVGRFASKLVGLQPRSIDRRDIEAAFFALGKDWERVCPLPIAEAMIGAKQSCPIPPATEELRDMASLEAVPA